MLPQHFKSVTKTPIDIIAATLKYIHMLHYTCVGACIYSGTDYFIMNDVIIAP